MTPKPAPLKIWAFGRSAVSTAKFSPSSHQKPSLASRAVLKSGVVSVYVIVFDSTSRMTDPEAMALRIKSVSA